MMCVALCIASKFAIVSDCTTCYRTIGPNVTTCEISPEADQFCNIECARVHSRVRQYLICTMDCVHSNISNRCANNVSTADFVTFCCTTSYCNILNGSLTTTVATPSPTTSEYIVVTLAIAVKASYNINLYR